MARANLLLCAVALGASVTTLGCGSRSPSPLPPIVSAGSEGQGETPSVEGEPREREPAKEDERYRELWSRAPVGGWAEASVFLPSGDLASVSRSTLAIHARHDGTVIEQTRVCDVIGPRAMVVLRGKLYLACHDRVVEVTVPGLQQKVMAHGVIDNGRRLFREAAFGGDEVVFTHNDGSLEIYSTTTWTKERELRLPKDTFAQHVAVSSDGRKFTVSNADAEVIHLFVDGKETKLADGLDEALAFSPDGTRLFGRSGSFQVGELDLTTGELRSLGRTGSWVTAGVYFGDDMLAIAGSDGLSVVRLSDGEVQMLAKMTAETLAVSADGRMICAADRGDLLACYARGEVAPSSYEPVEGSSGGAFDGGAFDGGAFDGGARPSDSSPGTGARGERRFASR